MSAPRRHRLHSLGQSARSGSGGRARYRDSGSAIGSRGLALSVPRSHEGYGAARAFSAPPAVDPNDWGWPAAEPSALSWPEPAETAFSFSVDLAEPVRIAPDPAPSITRPPVAANPPPFSPPPMPVESKPTPLADHEAEDDVAAILREKGLQPAQPQAPQVVQQPQPGQQAPQEPAEPPVNRHAVFDQLSRTMPHATSFQLGRFNFDRHFDMLEEGMSLGQSVAPAPQAPPPSGREMHELDLLSEIAALSGAAGMPLPREAETDAFMRRVAKAQGVSLASLAGEDEDEDEDEDEPEEEDTSEQDFAETEEAFEEETSSPWSEAEEEADEQETEEDDG